MANFDGNERNVMMLEREVRKLKILVYVLASLFFIFCFAGLSLKSASVVTANRFVLQDEKGKTRLEFGMDVDNPNVPYFAMYDENEEARVSISVLDDKSVGMAFLGASGRAGIGMGLDRDGLPSLSLMDRSGNVRCKLNVSEDSDSSITLANSSKTRSMKMLVSETGHGELDISDSQQKSMIRFQANVKGLPGLFISDGDELRAALGLLSDREVSLVLIDRDGKTVFQAPQTQ